MQYKNNHYVPQFILNNFKNSQGELYYYNKEESEKGIKSRNTEGIFRKYHIYTYFDGDGSPDFTLEAKYHKALENKAKIITDKIISSIRSGRKPGISTEEKQDWYEFFYHQWRRVPDFYEKRLDKTLYPTLLRNLFDQYETHHRPLTKKEKRYFLSEEGIQKAHNNVVIRSLRNTPEISKEVFHCMSLQYLFISDEKASLVIGSNPVVSITPLGLKNIREKSNEIWMPIAHDIMVGTYIGSENRMAELSDRREIRKFNICTWLQSKEVAGRSKKLIESLVNRR